MEHSSNNRELLVRASEAVAQSTQERLRFLARARGVTLGEISRATGIAYWKVERILNRRTEPRGDELLRIARALDVAKELELV